MKNWQQKLRLASLYTLLALILSGCSGHPYLSTLQPKGEGADMLYDLMMLSIFIMVGVILVVVIIYAYVLVRFREKKGQEHIIPKQVEGNHKLEIIWTVIPILLLLILAVPTVSYTFQLADVTPELEEGEEAITVNVIGYQYWWKFEYPDLGITTSQDLYIPTNERVYINLKAADVKHSFWIPTIAGKMDMNPGDGTINRMFINAYEEGTYYGKCAELCGPSHALMDFKVQAVSKEEFDQWVTDMKAAEVAPQTELAQAGEELFTARACIGCHAIGDQGGQSAPNLTNFGERSMIAGILDHNEQNLRDWLADPESIKPGNLMTDTYPELTKEELDALVEYLMGLKVTD